MPDDLPDMGTATKHLSGSGPQNQHIKGGRRVLETQFVQQRGRHKRVANAGERQDENAIHRPAKVGSLTHHHKAAELQRMSLPNGFSLQKDKWRRFCRPK